MAIPQLGAAMTLRQFVDPPPAPQETLQQVLDQTQEKLGLIENQVDEVIARLFNFPRTGEASLEKAAHVPSVNERTMDLRSRAMRINSALATLLDKL